jgi:N-methylhydantoinase B/oxoprolinase/acetone carboxylase alpha subunit
LADEGLVFRHVELADLKQLELTGCRLPAVVRADLRAQIAANTVLLDELASLGPSETVHAWMAHTLDATEALTARFIATLPTEPQVVSERLQGVPIELRLQRVGERLQIDLTGTGGPHPGNLNAPESVVRAAVLYALRVLLDTDLPLNEGVLRRVDLTLPSESLVSPPAGAAVVGGNVETSMRIADLVLRAAGRAAGSAGTMNNLTLGGNGWAFYETLGGGQGGTSRGPGASARQLHMTNTRATDPEVLEHRLPVRVRRFAIREGSGGAGTHPGGDGLVRELELLEPATAALLATRRDTGAPGLGGQPGQPGHDQVCRSGQWEAWTGEPVELAAGDRVRVETPGGGGWGSRG